MVSWGTPFMINYPYPVLYGESSLLCLYPEDSREFATLQLCVHSYLMHPPVQDSVKGSTDTKRSVEGQTRYGVCGFNISLGSVSTAVSAIGLVIESLFSAYL